MCTVKMAIRFFMFLFFADFISAQNGFVDEDDVLDCSITQWGGPSGPGKDCVFPFKYLGADFDLCTTIGEGASRPWCPTSVDADGVHRQGSKEWGYCDARCAFVGAGLRRIKGTTPKPGLRRSRPRRTTTVKQEFLPDIFTTSRPLTTTPSPPPPPSYTETNPKSLSGTWLPNPSSPNGECGIGLSAQSFVLGGEQAKRGEFPFMALIGYWVRKRNRVEYKCGGSLINRRYVVTAAHCHQPGELEISTIVLGEWDVGLEPDCQGCRPAQRFRPEEIRVHPDWRASSGGQGDLALVRLDRPATTIHEDFESVVLPICMNPPDTLEFPSAKVVGWGKATNAFLGDIRDFVDLGVSQRTLQKLDVPIMEFARCRAIFKFVTRCRAIFKFVTRKHLCAGGISEQDSCNGDSGGPLVGTSTSEQMFLIGVVSSGTPKCGEGKPGIYTKVEDYEQWIRASLRP